MATKNPGTKPKRTYKKDTFKPSQKKKVAARTEDVEGVLVLLGKAGLPFKGVTMLAKHVAEILGRGGTPVHPSALVRSHHIEDGLKVPNPYRLKMDAYLLGKYFGPGKNREITAEDIEGLRKKYPAVHAYCCMKEGEVKELQEQLKAFKQTVDRSQDVQAISHQDSDAGKLLKQLQQTVNALKHTLDAVDEFEIDWEQRAIVDTTYRPPKIVVTSDLLPAFLSALETCGMGPREGA